MDINAAITLNFEPSVKQFMAWERLMDKETYYVGYGGAAFSGKSYLVCNWLTAMCLAYPGTGWGMCRKELTNLKKTTLLTLWKVFNESNIIKDRDYIYNEQKNTIEFYNGSTIFLIDMARKPSDPEYHRFGGFELTGAAVDESVECDAKAIEILGTRTNRRLNHFYGLTGKVIETFNPAKNHVYSKYYKPHKDNKMQAGYSFIPALPSDNPSPEAAAYIEMILRTASKQTIERLINGNFEYDDDPAVLMDQDAITDYFSPEHIKPEGGKFMTIDVARKGRDTTVFRVWHGWLCIYRFVFAVNTIPEVINKARELQRTHNITNSNTLVDEDGVGGGVVDGLRCNGFINNSIRILSYGTC